jgi:hypothetical protein
MVDKGNGFIVNNATSSDRFPAPLKNIYKKTIAYVHSFSRFVLKQKKKMLKFIFLDLDL